MAVINAQFLFQALESALYARDNGDMSGAESELEKIENIIKGCDGLTFGGSVSPRYRVPKKLYRVDLGLGDWWAVAGSMDSAAAMVKDAFKDFPGMKARQVKSVTIVAKQGDGRPSEGDLFIDEDAP